VTLGARRGEMCALRWKHVDMETKVVTLRRAISLGEDGELVDRDTRDVARAGMTWFVTRIQSTSGGTVFRAHAAAGVVAGAGSGRARRDSSQSLGRGFEPCLPSWGTHIEIPAAAR
jgi:hypothetical protein